MMRFTSLVFVIFLSGAILFLDSCKHDPVVPSVQNGDESEEVETCDEAVMDFQNQVLPVLVSNCARSGCHDAATAQKGIVLDSFENVINSDVLDPFDADNSEIVEIITETDSDKRMPPPPASPLNAGQISLIQNWINQGAKNTVCEENSCDTSNVTFANAVRPILQSNCVGCHSGGNPSGGLNFSNHAGIQPIALNGTLLGAVNHDAGFIPMPQGGSKLADCEIEIIRIWIEDGALNN